MRTRNGDEASQNRSAPGKRISNGRRVARQVLTARRAKRSPGVDPGRFLLIACAAALLAATLLPVAVRAPPPIPMVVEGHAYDRFGAPLPAGTPIRAYLDGVDYSDDSAVQDAAGSFSLMIFGNWMLSQTVPETPTIKEGPNLGETVLFVSGTAFNATEVFQETAAWSPSATVTLDLHLGSLTSPSALRIEGIVTLPARGGNQYAFVCNPTAAPVSLFDYFLEVDRPGTYHGGSLALAGAISAATALRVNLTSTSFLTATGDALKIVYRNPGGGSAPAGGADIVVDRLEFNATTAGTLTWEPGNTILADAPAPGPGQMLNRTSPCGSAVVQPGFRLSNEPGGPPSTNVAVQILAPTQGQVLTGGQSFTFEWSMSDDFFLSAYLRVWINVSYGGGSYPLVAGSQGVTDVAWTVPDVSDGSAYVHIDAVDPYGAKAGASTGFVIQRSTPFAVLIAILVALVIVAFVLLAWWNARRKAREPIAGSGAPPSDSSVPSAETATLAAPTAPGTKRCPRCSSEVRAQDDSCFFCGYLFVKPPPP